MVPTPVERSYPITLTGLALGTQSALARAAVASRNEAPGSPDHHTRFTFNSRKEPLDDALWDGRQRRQFEAVVPQSDLREGENQLHLTLLPEAEPGKRVALAIPRMYFDWVEVSYARRFLAEGDELNFTAGTAGSRRYRVQGLKSGSVTVWDITDAGGGR